MGLFQRRDVGMINQTWLVGPALQQWACTCCGHLRGLAEWNMKIFRCPFRLEDVFYQNEWETLHPFRYLWKVQHVPLFGGVGRLCPSMFRVVDVYSCVPPPQKHFWKRALPETIIPEEMSRPSFSPGSTALEVPDPRRRGPYRRKKTPPNVGFLVGKFFLPQKCKTTNIFKVVSVPSVIDQLWEKQKAVFAKALLCCCLCSIFRTYPYSLPPIHGDRYFSVWPEAAQWSWLMYIYPQVQGNRTSEWWRNLTLPPQTAFYIQYIVYR